MLGAFLWKWSLPWALLLVATVQTPSIAASDSNVVHRVLILYENESTLEAVIEAAEGLRASLERHMPPRFEVYSEYLDTVRFPSPDHMDRLVADLSAKYADKRLDAVVTAGPGALQFILDHRERIAPGVPIVAGGLTDDVLNRSLPADVKTVISHFDARKTVDLARQLQPDAKRIAVMTGSSSYDQKWQTIARRDFGDRYAGLGVEYISDLTIDGFADAARKLDAQTILLVLTVFEDANGRKFVPRDAASEIVAASSAPAYGVYSSFVGAGVVGGFVSTFRAAGEQMGVVAGQVAGGDLSAPQATSVSDRPLLDWRQIRRWTIDRDRIPANAEVINYQPTAWEQNRAEILAALAVIALQAATIVALVIQERRRRRIGAELILERLELAHLARTTQLGALSGAFAHELNQPLTSILANAEAGSRLLDAEKPDLPELKEIFSDIVADNRRAVSVLAELRRLMVKGETTLNILDLNQAVSATMALARSELLGRQTNVDFEGEAPEVPVRANLAQLQQIILNLILNAADAMANLPPADRQIAIRTRKRDDGFGELTVSDRGPGVAPEIRDNVFKPFVSTKKDGLGLGLAICRTIAHAHGGTLQFEDGVDRGARLILALPAT
jgi:signal transduction histidine kinase